MIEAAGIFKSLPDARGRPRRVLDGVDLHVAPGRVATLTGDNGAGKTTLLRILAALIPADAGIVRVGGARADVEPRLVRREAGLLTEEPGLTGEATPLWHVALHASLSGVGRPRALATAGRLLAELGLGSPAKRSVRCLSRGERQKVAVARVLVRPTSVLLLDEPTASLDAVSARWLRREVRRRADSGDTVLIVTHDPKEAAEMGDQGHRLESGRIRAWPPGAAGMRDGC